MIRRRPKVKSGIERAPQREWPKHRQWIRGHECLVGGCMNRDIEAAHVRTGRTDGGTGLKPSDWWCVPLCKSHHAMQHQIGEPAFERMHDLDLKKWAWLFAERSTDLGMRKAMQCR